MHASLMLILINMCLRAYGLYLMSMSPLQARTRQAIIYKEVALLYIRL